MINHFQFFLYPGNNLSIDNFYGVFHPPKKKNFRNDSFSARLTFYEWQRISLLSLTKQRQSKIKWDYSSKWLPY